MRLCLHSSSGDTCAAQTTELYVVEEWSKYRHLCKRQSVVPYVEGQSVCDTLKGQESTSYPVKLRSGISSYVTDSFQSPHW